MSDQVLEQISEAQVDDETEIQPGTVFLFKWLAETWGEAGKGVVQQVRSLMVCIRFASWLPA